MAPSGPTTRLSAPGAYREAAMPATSTGSRDRCSGRLGTSSGHCRRSSPAWAAGAPVLMLRLLLGIEPDPHSGRLTTAATAPEWLDGLELNGVRAVGKLWRIAVAGGRVSAETA